MTNRIGTQLGSFIDTQLTKTPTLDSIRDGQAIAISNMEKSEDNLLKILSIGSGDQAALKAFAQKNGLTNLADKDGNYDKGSMQVYFQTLVERTSRTFMAAQKLGDRMHDMMMEVIRSWGRV